MVCIFTGKQYILKGANVGQTLPANYRVTKPIDAMDVAHALERMMAIFDFVEIHEVNHGDPLI